MFDDRERLSGKEIKGEAYQRKTGKQEVYSTMNRHRDSDNGKETAQPGPVFVVDWLDLPYNAKGHLGHYAWVQSVQVAVP